MIPLNKTYFKVIQITDTHLFKENADIFGIDSNQNFKLVLDQIKKTDLTDTDALFLTGDLSQDETSESYQLIGNEIAFLHKPTYWIPGNHDCIDTMQLQFSRYRNFERIRKLETKHWNFIFISTKLEGNAAGYISQSELCDLSVSLQAINTKNVAIIMHHHPVAVGTPLVDNCMLENSDEFFNVISDYKINLIVCGHVHNDYVLKHNNIDIQSSPATCLQFRKNAVTCDIERQIGYKVYYFMEYRYEYKTKIWNV